MSKIAVAGATGRLGRHVVDVLGELGYQVVPMSRTIGVDIITGGGLADALTGVETIIDVASWHSSDQEAATEFFRTSARNLHEYGRNAGVARIAMASIIGVENATAGFLAAKKVHEEVLLSGPLPVRILRAAQFHEFVGRLLDWQQGDVAYVPALPTQLVACRTVAETLVDLALGHDAPGIPVPEIAGPRKETMSEAAQLLGARRGIKVVAVDGSGMPDAEIAAARRVPARPAHQTRRTHFSGVARHPALRRPYSRALPLFPWTPREQGRRPDSSEGGMGRGGQGRAHRAGRGGDRGPVTGPLPSRRRDPAQDDARPRAGAARGGAHALTADLEQAVGARGAAARLWAAHRAPYLALAVFALNPVILEPALDEDTGAPVADPQFPRLSRRHPVEPVRGTGHRTGDPGRGGRLVDAASGGSPGTRSHGPLAGAAGAGTRGEP
ncbi:SDR family oxidoreductase [Nonomuraea fuscirosea]|uniref:SDR family oxidoreductase n=1 Tax=Nonomuraea fuscirosea TaxID=1291556 RepID=UPI00342CA992